MNAPAKLNYVDEAALPEWGATPDGRAVKIDMDERLPALFAAWQDDACSHPRKVIVERADSLGRPQFFEFCEDCGLKVSSAIAHYRVSKASDYTADVLEARNRSYVADRKEALTRITTQAAERSQSGNRIAYDDYLRSDDWRRRAAKIMKRAAGLCEGCLTNPPAEVHHLTYAHIGNEFAFELVALCRSCHGRVHGH